MRQALRTRTFIIADDLTGACDAAVAFSRRGLRTQVMLDAFAVNTSAEVSAVCTETRDVRQEEAHLVLRRVAGAAHGQECEQIFKKIDSVFRGNTTREILASIEVFSGRFGVIAPAYPGLGRTTAGGMLHVSDLSGEKSLPVREMLQEAGLTPRWIASTQSAETVRQQMAEALRCGERSVFCDALMAEDLKTVVTAASGLPAKILWIGSAGLAHALAGQTVARSLEERPATRGTVLVFAGSDHAVTQAQLAELRRTHKVAVWKSGESSSLPGGDDGMLIVVERGRTTENEIRSAVERIPAEQVACMVMTGGDTAVSVCRSLGITSLWLHEEFEAGLPQGIAEGGRFAGCNVILKSGGFGEAGVFSRIAGCFMQREEVSS